MSTSNSKVNVYVNSRFKKPDETNSRLSVIIPTGLLTLQGNDYYSISVNGFYMYNTIYQINENNRTFTIDFKNNAGAFYTFSIFKLNLGNPNVYQLRDNLNTLLSGICTVAYDKITNIFVFTRTKAVDNNYYTMYLNTKNIGQFFGFDNDTSILITSNGVESYYPINVKYHKVLICNIDGDIVIQQNNIDNMGSADGYYQASSCMFYKNIDVETNKLVCYDNLDANTSFQYKLSMNENINRFVVSFTNQDGEDIPDLGDWFMCLQFEKYKEDQTFNILRQIKEYLSYIFLVIANYIYTP